MKIDISNFFSIFNHRTFNFDNQASINTIDNNTSQSTIKSGRMNRNSIVIPRKRNYDYIKVTESILKDLNESDRKSGNKRNSCKQNE